MSEPTAVYLAWHEARCTRAMSEAHIPKDHEEQYRAAYMAAAREAYGTQRELTTGQQDKPLNDDSV